MLDYKIKIQVVKTYELEVFASDEKDARDYIDGFNFEHSIPDKTSKEIVSLRPLEDSEY